MLCMFALSGSLFLLYSSLGYSVTYNVAELSDAEALGTDGKLAKELRNIAKSVSDESRTFNGSWVVDKQATQQAMDKAIDSGNSCMI